ncbi:putative oligosaccharide repeat-containing polymerase [Actinobacillus pleuropneumoniae]|uniref:Oligosaccharide repeat unit polymerase n=2 Tax=Actinobacillus pleuropneumoniae TaxID=715 RepID=A0A0A1GYB5_ACTPL|nr:O-antigen polymerase [Actinobacillus pleuropneumoniae]QXP23505.1 oligosaccharide repeat unit polymerase [Actinobacillus pleuropneumoniae serovar 8 str. 405]KIE89561.1 putative oligosaccharide repeat-containing polymerase [Actinobacillus pleuropneumoniae]KIE89594.1 putative oligosaccharide repeat-containing polymerase [Actinobacillus pleuropneumoniae]KIE89628.1 putative oligosaccharide repeat-containing polymerase [Actinobacillus pleuropneumoniae]KIE94894.1 putative oligosaccharide repeat-co
MFLYLLVFSLLLILIFNLLIVNLDYMHPSILFVVPFLVFGVTSILGEEAYKIIFHEETLLVIVSSALIFTFITLLSQTVYKSKENLNFPLTEIIISKKVTLFFIVFFIVTQLAFIKYLEAISLAHFGYSGSLGEMISLYDVMTKFWTEIFSELNVPIPLLYRIGNPITQGFGYLIVYIFIHNYVATKRIDKLHLLIILLLCLNIILNGSRSPIFRIVTMMLITFYVLYNKQNNVRRGNIKFLLKSLLIVIFSGTFFIALLSLMGRENDLDMFHYIFIYVGAPLVNLDNYLAFRPDGSYATIFGEQTFRGLYAYIAKIISDESLIFPTIDQFTFSNNGLEIGNVYTTFYSFIYDFEYVGFIPLILIIALYYVFTYQRLKTRAIKTNKVHFSLFIYAYLFNDLIMLAFSNRFYTTVLDIGFIKIVIFSYICHLLFVHRSKIKGTV